MFIVIKDLMVFGSTVLYEGIFHRHYLEAGTSRAGAEELAVILPLWITIRERVG